MTFPPGFEPFVKKAPACVLAKVCLERLFRPERLDELFAEVAESQYVRTVLFSQVFELLMAVVLRVQPSVLAAFRERAATLSVSNQAVYDKLRRTELAVSCAVVEDSFRQIAPVVEALGAKLPPWLPGFRTRVVDGNLLSKTEKRLKVHRGTWAAALPGRALAVYDQETDLVCRVLLNADAHDNERVMIPALLATVEKRELVLADRGFCTMELMSTIAAKQARFVVRQHGSLKGRLLGTRVACGRTDTGEVYQQKLEYEYGGRTRRVRRITVVLDQPTSDGDVEIHLLTNLTAREARAGLVAELYRRRWTIEGRFLEMSQTMNGEPETLGYPPAALFAFCLALLASNAAALLRASVRAAHGAEATERLSKHYLAEEIRRTFPGMMIALPEPRWEFVRNANAAEFAALLQALGARLDPKRYAKSVRGPKKPRPPKTTAYENGAHVSTARALKKTIKAPEP